MGRKEGGKKRAYMRFSDVSSERVLTSSDSGGSVVVEMGFDGVQEGSSVAETVLEEG